MEDPCPICAALDCPGIKDLEDCPFSMSLFLDVDGEAAPCLKLTPGCSVDHRVDGDTCETW